MPVIGDGFGVDGLPQHLHPALVFLPGNLGLPLEGGVGLGDKVRGGNRDTDATLLVGGGLTPGVHHPGGHVGDAQHVLVGLRGQAQHEIQLHGAVTAGKGGVAALEQVVQGHIFINDITQTLGARLGGEGEAGFAALGQALHQRHGEVVRPQAGQGEIHMPLLAEVLQAVTQLRQGRVVAGGQGREGDLLVAGIVAGLQAVLGAQVTATVADGAVDVPRLAEAAAPDAAPEQLQHHPVLDDLRAGDDGAGGKKGLVQVADNALDHPLRRAVTGGDGGHGAVVVVGHVI